MDYARAIGGFDSARTTQASTRRAVLYSLIAAFITAFVATPSRYLGLVRSSPRANYMIWWLPAILVGIEFVVIVLVAAFSAALAGTRPYSHLRDAETRRVVAGAVSISVWTAPLVVLLLQRSILAGLIAGGIAVAAIGASGISAERRSEVGSSYLDSSSSAFVKLLALAILAAGLIQASALANWIDERQLSALLFVLGAAVLAFRLPSKERALASAQISPRNLRRAFTNAILAAAVAIAALLPLAMPWGHGRISLDALLRNVWREASQAGPARSVSVKQMPIRSDGYIGVILTPPPEKQKQTVTLATLPIGPANGALLHPLKIRFTGSYWFFQSPFVQPPYDSIHATGDPAVLRVHTSNSRMLLMQAVQNLGDPIESAAVGKIQLDVLDADADPASVFIEVALTDTKTYDHPEQSLGYRQLNVMPMMENASHSHSETLTYSVPVESVCAKFDQIKLRFRLAPARGATAAAVAIEDFLLLPRGN